MNAQHTPGPWINDGDTVSARPDPENSQTYIAPICVMDDEWDAGIAAANARLIAAAPELLEALDRLQLAVTMRPSGQGGLSLAERSALDAARAAIAKATGA